MQVSLLPTERTALQAKNVLQQPPFKRRAICKASKGAPFLRNRRPYQLFQLRCAAVYCAPQRAVAACSHSLPPPPQWLSLFQSRCCILCVAILKLPSCCALYSARLGGCTAYRRPWCARQRCFVRRLSVALLPRRKQDSKPARKRI